MACPLGRTRRAGDCGGLLALSADRSLREPKAKRWMNLQRLNYVLFVLVVLPAFFR
jgi:hypothetical protein